MPELWAVRVDGTDDLMACATRKDAELNAASLSSSAEWLFPGDDGIGFTVVPWPHSAEAHAADLEVQEEQDPWWTAVEAD